MGLYPKVFMQVCRRQTWVGGDSVMSFRVISPPQNRCSVQNQRFRIERSEILAYSDANRSHNGMRVSRIRRCESFAWNAASSSHKASLNPTLSFPPRQRATLWNPGLFLRRWGFITVFLCKFACGKLGADRGQIYVRKTNSSCPPRLVPLLSKIRTTVLLLLNTSRQGLVMKFRHTRICCRRGLGLRHGRHCRRL